MPRVSRRRFLGSTIAAAMGSSLPIDLFASSLDRTTRVVVVYDSNATSGSSVNADVVNQMVNAGIKQLTGLPTVGDAWKSLFPGIVSTSKISIKENLSWSQTSQVIVHPETTDAIVAGIHGMPLSGGALPLENIMVWDLDKDPIVSAGYSINLTGPGLRCYYAVQNYSWWINYGYVGNGLGFDSGYTCTINHPSPTTHHPTNIMTQYTDYMINVGILGYHSDAVITGVMKNHYGSFTGVYDVLMHYGGISRGIPGLNQYIRDGLDKQERLFMIDGLFGGVTSGPQGPGDCIPRKIIMGTDPVAVDYQMTQELNAQRALLGQGPVNPAHVNAAAGPPYNLGTNDPGEIELIEINNPSVPPPMVENVRTSRTGDDITVQWNAVSGVSNYNVYWQETAFSSETGLLIGSTVDTSYVHSGAAAGADGQGFYRVTAEF